MSFVLIGEFSEQKNKFQQVGKADGRLVNQKSAG
jgi:hypothetical protein